MVVVSIAVGREELRMFKMRRSSQDFTLFTSLGKFFYICYCFVGIVFRVVLRSLLACMCV